MNHISYSFIYACALLCYTWFCALQQSVMRFSLPFANTLRMCAYRRNGSHTYFELSILPICTATNESPNYNKNSQLHWIFSGKSTVLLFADKVSRQVFADSLWCASPLHRDARLSNSAKVVIPTLFISLEQHSKCSTCSKYLFFAHISCRSTTIIITTSETWNHSTMCVQ